MLLQRLEYWQIRLHRQQVLDVLLYKKPDIRDFAARNVNDVAGQDARILVGTDGVVGAGEVEFDSCRCSARVPPYKERVRLRGFIGNTSGLGHRLQSGHPWGHRECPGMRNLA